MVQFVESLETNESTDVPDPSLPDLVEDSDDEDVSRMVLYTTEIFLPH